jgi:Family of unknown function (DUF6600)
MKIPFLALAFVATVLALASCNQRPDNSAQLKALEERIRQLEDQEKQIQHQTEQEKLATDGTVLEAEKAKRQQEQNTIAPSTPAKSSDGTLHNASSRTGTMDADSKDGFDSNNIQEMRANSFNLFYERLQPEGHWLEDSNYGYVWQPNVAEQDENWRPYTDGHWAYTDRGWTWLSNEDFGWATYHYGRWARVRDTGWVWVPGATWAPAWVSWRQTDQYGYVGWAPLPPECVPASSENVEAWVDNYYDIGPAAYVFLRAVDLARSSYRGTILPSPQSLTIIAQTRNVTNITCHNNVVNAFGPQYQQMAQLTNYRLGRYQINYQQQTQSNANFKTVIAGNQLQVISPPAYLQNTATIEPQNPRQIQQTQVERGWQNIDPDKARQIKRVFQQGAPPIPKALPPQPAAPPKAVFVNIPIKKPGQPPAAARLPQMPAVTVNNDDQIAAERAKIEAEKVQLIQQKQALLTGQRPLSTLAPPGQQTELAGEVSPKLQADQQQKEQPVKLLRAQVERTKQLAAPKSPLEEQAQPNRPADQAQRQQAEQPHKDQAIQQQHSEAENVKQTEEKKAKEERASPPGHSPQ